MNFAFLVGLTEDISKLLRVFSRIDELTNELLARARNILKEPEPITAAASTSHMAFEHYGDNVDSLLAGNKREGLVCFKCGGPNHFVKVCWSQNGTRNVYP